MNKFEYSFHNGTTRNITNWNQNQDGHWLGDYPSMQVLVEPVNTAIKVAVTTDNIVQVTSHIPTQVIVAMLEQQGYTVIKNND